MRVGVEEAQLGTWQCSQGEGSPTVGHCATELRGPGRQGHKPQPPQGTHLMGIEINDGGSGDAFHSLKQKLPAEGRRK